MNIHLVAHMDFALRLRTTSVNQIFLLPNHMMLYIILAKLEGKNHHCQNMGQRERAVLILNSLNRRTNKICLCITLVKKTLKQPKALIHNPCQT